MDPDQTRGQKQTTFVVIGILRVNSDVARTLKKLRTSKGDYWISSSESL